MTNMPPPLLLEAPRRERPVLAPPARLERVLIVEDDPVQATLLSLMLERLHVQYLLVTDGEQAIEAVKLERFRLVLMDYLMPVANGIEATRRIRRFEREHGRERVPIVAVTASVMRSECEAYLAAGMDDVVLKPFSAQSLADAVARHGAAHPLSLFVPGVVS
jgi:CheY-like chemotaxis protein